jgi:sulfoxide reductase heme-binding subunit YedZ
MSGDGSSGADERRSYAPRLGWPFGGHAEGILADRIARSVAVVLLVSAVFSAFPGIDVWFSALFADTGEGFPLQNIAAFDAFGRVGLYAVVVVLAVMFVAIAMKLARPDRQALFPLNAIAFLLVGLVAVSILTPVILVAAESGRSPPSATHPLGGHEAFVALWQTPNGACTTDCAAFSVGTMWAVWLVGAAVLASPARRAPVRKALVAFAALLALNVVARGEAFLSGVLMSAAVSALIVAVAYRFTVERPLPRLAGHRLEHDLTRSGWMLRRLTADADWAMVAAKAQSPWRDRLGRISPLKATTFALALLPGAWLLWLSLNGELTPLPWVFLVYHSGVWALWMFLATLAVTPVRHVFGWSDLIAVRRMLGIAGLGYTLVHLGAYLWLDRFSPGFILNEVLTRPTIWVAMLSTIGIFILGATSLDEVIRRMGSAAWNRLHYLAYPAIGLGILHFAMAPGSLGGLPFLMAGMFLWLMAWRVLHRYGIAASPVVLLAMGLAAAVAGLAFEVAWLALYQGTPAEKTIAFTFELAGGLAPAWQLLVVGLTIAGLAVIFGRKSRGRARLRVQAASPPIAAPLRRLQPT